MKEVTKKQRCVDLAWRILEYKCAYYRPQYVHIDNVDRYVVVDAVYDAIEAEYRQLCKELGVTPSACDMVDFDESRPSCQLVKTKLGKL
jgi:hypothetical protein